MSLRIVVTVLLAAGLVSVAAADRRAPHAADRTNTFVREPVVVYSSDAAGVVGQDRSTLIVYRDGLSLYSRSADAANPDGVVRSVNVGLVKVRSLLRSLIGLGAVTALDGATADPQGVAHTLTVMEPGTDAVAHTFSFGANDYPRILSTVNAFITRLGV
jgi:hypothetical protein